MYTDYQAEIHFLIDPQWTPLGVNRSGQCAHAQYAGDEAGSTRAVGAQSEASHLMSAPPDTNPLQ
jgi:hypothetical protein